MYSNSDKSINDAPESLEQLKQRISDLERKNQELESFAYVASHDLQEPLRKIHIFSERILETEAASFSEKAKDHFNRILSASSRMQKLIDALLNYSKTNTDEKVFVKRDLNKILEEAKQNLEELISEKKAIIQSSELPSINIIPHQILQLFENLISNSLKYSKPNVMPVIVIKAQTRKIEKRDAIEDITPGNYWHITIEDNGIGFPNEYNTQIFELFQRLHGKHEYEGTGIGLAICKKIVENHHGTIYAEGALDKGAKVNILMPFSP